MSTVNAPRRRVKPARSIRWIIRPDEQGQSGMVRITVGKDAHEYYLSEVPSDFGADEQGFELEKLGTGEKYHVLLDRREGRHTCECKGFLRWGHCKHAECLLALLNADQQYSLPSAA